MNLQNRYPTKSPDVTGCIPRLFEVIAERFPDRPAVITQSGSATYGELNRSVNRIAHRLLRSGNVGDRIGYLIPYGVPLIATVLAGLKAGRMVVALDPGEPIDRLTALVGECSPSIIVADEQHRILATEIGGAGIEIVDADDPFEDFPSTNPDLELDVDDDALLLFTSGSTGKPKALVRSHGLIVHRSLAVSGRMGVKPDDRFVALKSLWSGQGLAWLFISLLRGASFLPFPASQMGVTGLADWIRDQKGTILCGAASLLRHFMKTLPPETVFPNIRLVRASADATREADYRAVQAHFPNAGFAVMMGASETGTIAYLNLSPQHVEGKGAIPVGRPLDGVDIRVVDEAGNDCAPGAQGVLRIRSRFLASRYWNDPKLTAQTFFDCDDGTRIFQSNDMASINEDGILQLAGRNDDTYKIRGLRVDLGEVELSLARLPGIQEVCAIVSPRANGESQLVAFFIGNPEVPPSPGRLRAIARSRLPRHLIPSALIPVDQLPRTPNGKVDRGRLRAQAMATAERTGTPPVTDTEKLLASLWAEAFDLEGIGRDDDFFALGGDSLIGAVIAARTHGATGVQITFRDFIASPCLRDLAGEIDRKAGQTGEADAVPLVPKRRIGPIRLSPAQEVLWSTSKAESHAQRGNKTVPVELIGPLEVDVLRKSLNDVVARHEILRTRFAVVEGSPAQIVDPPSDVRLALYDLPESNDPSAAIAEIANEASLRRFDLAEAPPLRFELYRASDEHHYLVRTCHHIISDGPSWSIFFGELAEVYEAHIEKRPPELDPPAVQFADFSTWQREVWRQDGEPFQKAAEWWKRKIETDAPVKAPSLLVTYLRKKPAKSSENMEGACFWNIDSETSLRLDQVGDEISATPYVVRLAAVASVTARVLRQDRIVVGGVFTHRGRHELQSVMGPLVNPVPLIFPLDWNDTFRDHVGKVRQLVLDGQDQSGLPFEWLTAKLVSEGIEVPNPVIWFHSTTPSPKSSFADMTLVDGDPTIYRSRALFVSADLLDEQNRWAIGFDSRLYALESMEHFAGRMQQFMHAAARSPDATLRQLSESGEIS